MSRSADPLAAMRPRELEVTGLFLGAGGAVVEYGWRKG